MPARGPNTKTIRRTYDSYRWLAAAVLLAAFRDWSVYHSEAAAKLRATGRNGGRVSAALARIARGGDPAEFLCHDSQWHRLLDLEPDRCQALLDDAERRRAALVMMASYARKQGVRGLVP